jgi:hypothetical protein
VNGHQKDPAWGWLHDGVDGRLTAAQGKLTQMHQLLGRKLGQRRTVGTSGEFDRFVGTHDFVLCFWSAIDFWL